MPLWIILCVVFAAGAVGGAINALLADNGFIIRPFMERRVQGAHIIHPGFVGNVLIGAVAAVVSWGLYGPFASMDLLEREALSLTPSTFASSILVGVAGAKWLTSEVDKRLLRVAASQAAKGRSSPETSAQILISSPAEALRMTKKL